MAPIDIGIGFENLERMARPPIVPDGTYSSVIDKVEDSPVQQSGRPQWNFHLKIVDRPDLPNRILFYRAQLPWIDPDTKQWDYSFTFGIVDIVNGTGMQITQPTPDPTGATFYGVVKEVFVGRAVVIKVGHKPRKDDPETVDNTVKIVTKKKSGGLVS